MQMPSAQAIVRGSEQYPLIHGRVLFYRHSHGTAVVTEIDGLPSSDDICKSPIFGFHIHSGSECRGNAQDAFSQASTHFDPNGCPHPYHAGDMPPLFGAGGYAFSSFITDRFSVGEIIGKTVIIHSMPDDFTSQPSGNAGAKIACGEIVPYRQK